MTTYVQAFSQGNAKMKELLGGKGANLAEMTRIGLPVPPGFTITTQACLYYAAHGVHPQGLDEQVHAALSALETQTGKQLGHKALPLLVSVRSGAAVSMPGMMDTVLNLGLNDDTVQAHAAATQNPRFAWDCYRRLIQMFSNVVLQLPMHEFEKALNRRKAACGAQTDPQIPTDVMQQLVNDYKQLVLELSGKPFPQDPRAQLDEAVRAVFASWNNPRAVVYRRLHKISDSLGTAVNIQAMAFGNMGDDCATGVAFTRDPNSGEKMFYGEYLLNAQGEDVVAGIRTPRPIIELKEELPQAYDQLFRTCELLEAHYGDMQDIEFTIERGHLYMLQCRVGKRTAQAAIRIAVDLVAEGKIDQTQALLRVEPSQIETLLHRRIDPKAKVDVVATGLPASPGAACGAVCFDPDEAEKRHERGEKVLLIRHETTPDDIHGMVASEGVLTTRGGMTCHAAIVARGMGKPCIVGCSEIVIDEENQLLRAGDRIVRAGDIVSIDGGTGRLIMGQVPLIEAQLSKEVQTLLQWADAAKVLGVRANADTPADAQRARDFGAQGIGLCRTEHMFGQGGHHPERMAVVQQMILAETLEDRLVALAALQPMQELDFRGILLAMAPYPVTIRLLDPPLHEFLPGVLELSTDVARAEALGQPHEEKLRLLRKVKALAETNPMLGFRGVRLGVIYPEIYEMQVRAIFAAGSELFAQGIDIHPEIMIPLVGHVRELKLMRDMIARIHEEMQPKFSYLVGTMIEVPRAALTAADIAGEAEFFSFGTNDLTQTTYGYSRDDAESRFLSQYVADKVLPENPFVTLDRDGVGKLVRMATVDGRYARPGLKVGICGEHGGDPASIAFCHEIGLSYVSCSPFRVPIARLAAAQAALAAQGQKATASAV